MNTTNITVESYANEIGLTVDEVLDLCEKFGISAEDKDSLLSTENIELLNNNLSTPPPNNFNKQPTISNSPTTSLNDENNKDIEFTLEDLYYGNRAFNDIISKFESLASALNSVDIGGVELSTAPNLAIAKSNISNLLSGSVTEIGSRVENVKTQVEQTDPSAAFIFKQLDIMYGDESNVEFANYLDIEDGTINPKLFTDMAPFDEKTSDANTEFWNNFQSFLNSDGSINEDKVNEFLQVHPEVNCAENCINFYQSVFNEVTEQYESLKDNQEFINEWEKGNFVDELGNLNYDLINKYKGNNSNTTFIDSIVSNYETYLKQAGQLDLNDINNTSTGKFGQLDLTNLNKLSILGNLYGEIPITEGSIYISDNITKSDILFNIERAYTEAAIDVYSSMISLAGINSERCKGLIDSQKKLVDATINYLGEKQKILDDQFEYSVRPILNYEDPLSEIWDYTNAQEYYNILELMRGNEISIVQLNRYFKENESYEIFSSSGDLITFTREDFEGFVQILDKHVTEETGNTYSQIITKQNEIVTLISTLKSSKYRIRQIEKELPYMEIAESNEYSKYLENIQDEHSIKLDFRANGEDIEYVYIIDGQEETDINPLIIAELIEDGKLDKLYGINFQYSDAYNNYKYLSDNNKNMYNYLYETKGLQVAEEYLKAIEDSINQKKGLAEAEEFLNSIRDKNGNIETSFLNHLKSGGEGTFDGIENFFDGLGNFFKTEGMMSSNQYKQMQILQELSTIDKSIIDNFYELGTSFGNMLPSMVLGAVTTPLIGSIAMGASTFGNSKNQALVQGNDLLSSTAYGLLSGVSETVLGYFLGNMPGMSQIAKLTVGDIFKEGVEEFIQEYVDAGLRSVLLNETIDAEQLMGDAGKSFLYGMILSAGTNSATTVGKAVCNIRINGETVKINDAKSLFNFFSLFNSDKVAIQNTSDGKKVFVLSPEVDVDSELNKINELFSNVPLLQQNADKSFTLLRINGQAVEMKITDMDAFQNLLTLIDRGIETFYGSSIAYLTDVDCERYQNVINFVDKVLKIPKSFFKNDIDKKSFLFGDDSNIDGMESCRQRVITAINNNEDLVTLLDIISYDDSEFLSSIGLYNIVYALNQYAVKYLQDHNIIVADDKFSIDMIAAKNPDYYDGAYETILDVLEPHLKSASENKSGITSNMISVANNNNGHLKGLEHSLKTEESAIRKVYNDWYSYLEEKGLALDASSVDSDGNLKLKDNSGRQFYLSSDGYIRDINGNLFSDKNGVVKAKFSDYIPKDLLRYTIISDNNHYVSTFIGSVRDLESMGYKIKKFKSSWPGKFYKGINLTFEKDSQIFELQFHTENSFYAKDDGTHAFYEIKRNKLFNDGANQSSVQRVADFAQILVQSQVDVPVNAEKLKLVSGFIECVIKSDKSIPMDNFNDIIKSINNLNNRYRLGSFEYNDAMKKYVSSLESVSDELNIGEFLLEYFNS